MITNLSQLDPDGTYTYADYLKWQFDQSVELIKGKLYNLSLTPRTGHQRFSMRITGELYNYFKERICEVFPAPFDVRLPNPDYEPGFTNKVLTVVQPDICVICDPAKIDELGCVGPPDWIIEITSPSTHKKDVNEKCSLYEAAGVREYWIAIPKSAEIYAYTLVEGRFEETAVYEKGSTPVSSLFPAISLDMDWLFG